MRLARFPFLLALALALAGCGPARSIYPLVEARFAEAVGGIEGRWRGSDGTANDLTHTGGAYRISGAIADSTDRIEVRFVRLGGRLFADLTRPWAGGDLAVHYLARVRAEGDSLVFDLLDESWVREHRGRWWGRLRAEFPEGEFVLTEPTPGLQRFVRKHADVPGAFTEGLLLRRER